MRRALRPAMKVAEHDAQFPGGPFGGLQPVAIDAKWALYHMQVADRHVSIIRRHLVTPGAISDPAR